MCGSIPRSLGAGGSLHMAFNYWFQPPSNLDPGAWKKIGVLLIAIVNSYLSPPDTIFERPYTGSYWTTQRA